MTKIILTDSEPHIILAPHSELDFALLKKNNNELEEEWRKSSPEK